MFYRTHMKPFFDKGCTIIGLLIISPVLLLICMINLMLYKKVFFIQERSGYKMQSFKMIKFQTMRDEQAGIQQTDMQRMTGFGKILRLTSLDELPQLFNILKGEMSIVGPRPLLLNYAGHYSDEQKQRFEVIPGITGWAQVNGRNKINWKQRFVLDNFYVQNISFGLDILILVKTFFQILKIHEVHASKDFTMKPFKN
ncbi:MAG: sugar transferase [Cytophaga sp.]|uniref:sugar transferase n=1 Tax=Cytophaga sp. TaxID=29535 RepID=UPI003F7D1104